MIWTLLTCFLLFVFAVEYYGKKSPASVNEMTFILVIVLSLLSGLRGEMGVDLAGYRTYFHAIPSLAAYLSGEGSFMQMARLEPLYQFLISVFKVFSKNHQFFLFTQSLVLFLIVVHSLRTLDAPVNIGIICYFFISYLDHFGQQRMAIVYVLCLYATTHIVRYNPVKFIATVIAATLIHYSAIFFLPAYWIRYLLLEKGDKLSYRNYINNYQPRLQKLKDFVSKHITFKNHYRNKVKLNTIIILFLSVLVVSVQFNIAQILYENIDLFTFGNPAGNIYASKFLTYYQRVTEQKSILGAWVGILGQFAIVLFVYLYRDRWLDIKTAPIFINFVGGLFFMILAFKIPHLGGRVSSMYNISLYVFIFSIMASQKKRSLNILPFIFFFLLYEFITHINSETGPYIFMNF